MGCIESKKIAETPPGDIQPVYHLQKPDETPRETSVKSELRVENATNLAEKIKIDRQINKNKFKTKYDPRITAKYEIKALIGKGTFTRVVRVENRQTKQPYAIKLVDNHQGQEAFQAELSILRRVKCPYIMQLVEVFEATDRTYMVMELATGGDLFDKVLSKGAFNEHEAVKVLIMVLQGVRYLHSLGITHRDLKPDNLLYYHPGSSSRIIITDFGLAYTSKSADDVYMTSICGTPEYIAPEMVARKEYTNAVDLWAVGVITYILLRGDFPFFHTDRIQLYKMILKGKYDLYDQVWEEVSQSGKDFVKRLLEVDPSARLTAVEALRHKWILAHHHNTCTQQSQSPVESWSRCSSSHSSRSARSATSLRAGRRRVQPQELEWLTQSLQTSVTRPTLHPTYTS